ncbi:MAG TPA: DUF4259 domain-containing protein [Planctomicrobium sp.]|nr:DUF4259 domain-containing protein [Planctomicrobium sp.]
MGAWGYLPFDNDTTNDWAYGLEEVADLSLVESAFDELEAVGAEYLDQDIACNAIGACEVLARLLGRPGYTNAYTEKVDEWVANHQLNPSPRLLKRADTAIDRILGEDSELQELWYEGEGNEGDLWKGALEDLRARLHP